MVSDCHVHGLPPVFSERNTPPETANVVAEQEPATDQMPDAVSNGSTAMGSTVTTYVVVTRMLSK